MIPSKKGNTLGITSSFTLIPTSKIKMRRKSSKRKPFQNCQLHTVNANFLKTLNNKNLIKIKNKAGPGHEGTSYFSIFFQLKKKSTAKSRETIPLNYAKIPFTYVLKFTLNAVRVLSNEQIENDSAS
jgi:hypothetical protein